MFFSAPKPIIKNKIDYIFNKIGVSVPDDFKFKKPSSGLYLFDFLKKINLKNKKVCDMGTGHFGFLASCAKYLGAKKVTACDIDKTAIKNARKLNNLKDI